MAQKKTDEKSSGVNIGSISAGSSVKVGDIVSGDKVGRNKITTGDITNATVAVGGNVQTGDSSTDPDLATILAEWQTNMKAKIAALPELMGEDKEDLKEQIDKIQEQIIKLRAEVDKGGEVNPSRLERLINGLGTMGPDIFEVVIATITNPLAGIGLVLKKIGDKIKLERQTESS